MPAGAPLLIHSRPWVKVGIDLRIDHLMSGTPLPWFLVEWTSQAPRPGTDAFDALIALVFLVL
jgi:hypothetical protein